MEKCIVLNADWTPLNEVSWEEAMCMVYLKKAEIIHDAGAVVRTFTEEYVLPMVVRLYEMVTKIFKPRTGYNRRNVFTRDKWTCQYCSLKFDEGSTKKIVFKNGVPEERNLTIDHVKPRGRGGKTSYLNCVASCCKCNHFKADRTPEEAAMHLKRTPYEPQIIDGINAAAKKFRFGERLVEMGVF